MIQKLYLDTVMNQGAPIHFSTLYLDQLTYDHSYCPGDGFMYSIRSALGKSIIRRLGLAHMSDEWKEYILANYETKRPERRPRYSPSRGQVLFGGRIV